MTTFEVGSGTRKEFVDTTPEVRATVVASRVASGIRLACVPHTTAGVTVSENRDPDVAVDVKTALARAIPAGAGCRHGEGSADARVKSVLTGRCQAIPVDHGRLAPGRQQGISPCEFDRPRQRRCMVKVIADTKLSGG